MQKTLRNQSKLKNIPQLPEDYAARLLDKEIDLETECTLENLQRLIQFYSEIIEYFEHINDPRFYDFQDRMHKTLMRPEILKLMNEDHKRRRTKAAPKEGKKLVRYEEKPVEIPSEVSASIEKPAAESTEGLSIKVVMPPEQEIKPVKQHINLYEEDLIRSAPTSPRNRSRTRYGGELKAFKPKEEEKNIAPQELSRKIIRSNPKAARNLERIVENNDTRVKKVTKRAGGDLKSMESSLEERLAQRKQKKLSMSMDASQTLSCRSRSSTVFNFDFSELYENEQELPSSPSPRHQESDRSGGFSKFSPLPDIEELEEKIMEIMERSYSEKSRLVTDIKVKYQAQIQDLEGQGPLFAKIIEQMKISMDEEIKKITEEIDNKRKDEIRIIKSQC
ncbi:unnamed protein product [Blepharisma stoltei]|uniref:Uncharacterized protein n=1 Tax=Blepharisma stoltei TaxID=1481888 RepID=A0AAU9IWG0_9CILI|nr:unnamed protein product [Blepharisma stoltei]